MRNESLYLFFGENHYALSRELKRWKDLFREKHGPENLSVSCSRDLTLSDVLDLVMMPPFIAEKRLVILEGVPKIEKEDCRRLIQSVHPQVVLVIVDQKPDKRLGSVKEIEKVAQLKSFAELPRPSLVAWLQELARGLDCFIDDQTASVLLSIVGEDQWLLDTELRKACLFIGSGTITSEHLELVCAPSGTQVIWTLTDHLGAGRTLEALSFLRRCLDRGEDPYGIWSVLLNAVKNLLFISAAVASGLRDERSIMASTKLPFPSVRGLLPLAKKLPLERAVSIADFAVMADKGIKTGSFRYTVDHPHEIITLSERLILLCSCIRSDGLDLR